MSNEILIDTDILVDFLRGNREAVFFLKAHLKEIVLSSISVAELYAGVKDNEEQEELDEFVKLFPILHITKEIAKIGGLYKRDFAKSHGIGIADAIIAATIKVHKLELKTLNIKHYPMLKGLKAPYSKK